MTLTDSIGQEKEEEDDLTALNTVLTHRYDYSKT